MKRFLLWVVGVILGVAVLLGAVMTVSYSFTGEGSRPAADTQFGGQALEVNGSCWQVPLLGGVFDKVFTSPETLTVQKLGVLYDAHPALALPDWASYTTLTIETDIGSIVFAGSASQYEDFLFPANGDYKAKLTVWRLPQDYLATQFEGGSTGAIRKNLGVEHPARPTGWYSYSFRFTLQASAEVALSTERLEQGGIAALSITGLTGETAPAVETDLGSVQCVRLGIGGRAHGQRYRQRRDLCPDADRSAQGFRHCGGGAGTCIHRGRQRRVPEQHLASVRAARAGKALGRCLPLPGRKLHDAGGFRSGQGDRRPAGQPLQLHPALHHPR